MTALLRSQVDQLGPDGEKTWGEQIVKTLLEQAVGGNLRAMQEIWSRLEGRAGAGQISPPLAIDDGIARKILDAVLDDDDEPPHD